MPNNSEVVDLSEILSSKTDIVEEEPAEVLQDMEIEELEDLEEEEEDGDLLAEDLDDIEIDPDVDEACAENIDYLEYDDAFVWEPNFDLLSKNINTLTTGLDLPPGIFSLAVNFFNIKSGIFLTYESNAKMFVPISFIGVDETTLRRCRISLGVLQENNLIFNGTNIHPSLSKDFLKNYLSKRLWDTIENLDMFVFSHHDRIFGLLLMFNLEINTNPQYIDFASFFTRKCSEIFFNSRARVINNLPDASSLVPVSEEEVPEQILSGISKINDKEILSIKLIFIKYTKIVDYLLEKNKSIDRYRIENDIIKMYNSMLFGSSFMTRINNGSIIICLATGLNSNNMIIKHQMTSSLVSLFENNTYLPLPEVQISDFDLDGETLNDDIRAFLSAYL